MKIVVTGMSAVLLLGLAACADNNLRPTDTGNMAYPRPRPAGNIGTTTPPLDTGSMAQPRSSGGLYEAPPTTPDTGNMALPSAAQGNSLPGRVR